ncbi:hypothetical protein Enr13x_36850 [Stieleria neptunia]|uniref:Uncharacterized protein n=1 Tax=Stieleria neptunia TaxID=2527979 RepID=A0A518HSJ7_9BACT|nr:hypothetical protein [Stieleria neptunia]QDV43825.1 hypothetical protein Enr13x_36850 [Stieleria neptunia]
MKRHVDIKPEKTSVWLLRLAAVLWVIWGLVHVLAGVMTITQDTPEAIGGIADAVDPETLKLAYPDAAGAVINQHGFNLLWIGAVTTICAIFVWRRSKPAMLLAALVAGLADVGYFLFMDLGGFVNFIPGTLMTLICLAAIVSSGIGYLRLFALKADHD